MKTKVFFGADEDVIDIRNDNVFKAVFTKNTPASRGALSKLVSALIDRNVSVLEILPNEPPPESLVSRQIRYDINCRAEDGDLINVEMSFYPKYFLPVFMEYFSARLFSGQNIKGIEKSYNSLKYTYQITIIGNERFFPDSEFFHVFEYYDPVKRISLGGRSKIISCELTKLKEIAEKPVKEMNFKERWAVFFEYLTNKEKRSKINEITEHEEGIAMASEVLRGFTQSEIEFFRQTSELKAELELQSLRVDAKREGMLEGKREERQHFLALLKSGMSPEEIIREYDK